MRSLHLVAVVLVPALILPAQSKGLYDVDTVRTFYLTFSQQDWWVQLGRNRTSKTELPATLTVDNRLYQQVGVRFRGTSSYFATGPSQKKSFNLTMDSFLPGQTLMGYDSLNLSNSFNDPTFMREVLSYQILRQYMPAPQASFIKLYINNEYWGVYINVQQPDKRMMGEWYAESAGNRYRCDPPRSSGFGKSALQYLGSNVSAYQAAYELKTTSNPKPWTDLIQLCNVLNNSGAAKLPQELPKVFNVDQALWYLALNITMLNLDSYVGRGNDYYLYNDERNGQLVMLPWDMNESFGGFGAGMSLTARINVSPYWNSTNSSSRPLLYHAFQVVEWRQRYVTHIHTIVQQSFNWPAVGALVTKYQKMIDADVKADTKKLYTYQQFQDNVTRPATINSSFYRTTVPGLKEVVDGRAKYLLAHQDVANPRPTIANLQRSPQTPQQTTTVTVTAKITGTVPVAAATLHYRVRGPFVQVPMLDDGKSGDGKPGDGVYGGAIPPQKAGSVVEYYVSARSTQQSGGAMSFLPRTAAHRPPTYMVDWPTKVSTIVLNEFMARNTKTIRDGANEYDDWLELYNTTNTAVNVGGMYLTDNSLNSTKWSIPANTSVPALGTLLIWCDEDGGQGPLHANFKLAAAGETLSLFDRDGLTRLDTISYGPQQADVSTGRVFDAQTPWVTWPVPTPGKINDVPQLSCGFRQFGPQDPTGHRMTLATDPARIGRTFDLKLANGPSSGSVLLFIGAKPGHLVLGGGVTFLLAPPLLGPVPVPTQADGSFRLRVLVPNDNKLIYQRFYAQTGGVDAQGFTASNGLELIVCQ
ncbi:MAG: CotH kinase family protein [Planctomycetota bacterium]|jgi:spore coat protein CotH